MKGYNVNTLITNRRLWLVTFILNFVSTYAFGIAECTGYRKDTGFVTVHIETNGPTGTPNSGIVTFEQNENKFGYRFGKEEISQFFEFDDSSGQQAVVGALVYVNKEAPVTMKYVGKNYIDMDLRVIIKDKNVIKNPENVMRVWKGPGYSSTEQIELKGVVCSIWSNI